MFLWLNTWYSIFCLPLWQKHQFNICTWMEKFNLTYRTFIWKPCNFILWGRQVFSTEFHKISARAQWWHFGISLFRHKLFSGMVGQTFHSYNILSAQDIYLLIKTTNISTKYWVLVIKCYGWHRWKGGLACKLTKFCSTPWFEWAFNKHFLFFTSNLLIFLKCN